MVSDIRNRQRLWIFRFLFGELYGIEYLYFKIKIKQNGELYEVKKVSTASRYELQAFNHFSVLCQIGYRLKI